MKEDVFITIEVKQEWTYSMFQDLIIIAVEGGINYWAQIQNASSLWSQYYGMFPDLATAEIMALMLKDGFTIELMDVETEEMYYLTLKKIIEGLGKYFSSKHHVDFEDFDANDADNIIQYALFGEVVFG